MKTLRVAYFLSGVLDHFPSGAPRRVVTVVLEAVMSQVRSLRAATETANQPIRASVLVIDDDEGTLATYSAILRHAGFETDTAATGQRGIDLAVARTFDVVLVDLRLPDCSGLDVLRELKQRGISGRIVVLTAFPTLDSSFDAGTYGADGYVEGPLDGDELVNLAKSAFEGRVSVRHPHAGLAEARSPVDPRVRQVMRLISRDLARAWSMEELSTAVALSESGLRHLFHAELGISVTAFRTEHRLQAGAWRLTTTHDNIRQLAYSFGYEPDDFRRAFRERFGVSPKAYRAQCWRGLRSIR